MLDEIFAEVVYRETRLDPSMQIEIHSDLLAQNTKTLQRWLNVPLRDRRLGNHAAAHSGVGEDFCAEIVLFLCKHLAKTLELFMEHSNGIFLSLRPSVSRNGV
jgi:hypothetical protein